MTKIDPIDWSTGEWPKPVAPSQRGQTRQTPAPRRTPDAENESKGNVDDGRTPGISVSHE